MLEISKYKLSIIGVYLILIPLFFAYTPNVLRYDFERKDSLSGLFLLIFVALYFYGLNRIFNYRIVRWQENSVKKLLRIFFYAIIFSIPEEILFRGIVQGYLQNLFSSMYLAIFFSSLIFGLAHLPNGGSGLHPKKWNWEFALLAFFAGLPLGLSFTVTENLLFPTILHAIFLIFYFTFTERSHSDKTTQ